MSRLSKLADALDLELERRRKRNRKPARRKKATRKKSRRKSTNEARRARMEDYLAYGYIAVNEYLRDPKAYRAAHSAAETRSTARKARAFVRDLRVLGGRTRNVCRSQLLSTQETLRALANRKFSTKQPMFASTDSKICKAVREALEPGPGEQRVDLRITAPAVDVSGYGRKRRGEVLVVPGELEVKRATVRGKSVHLTARKQK